jgi:catechol 2,3-dioxygenase-like lactoylglutathione lyase family enzyme
MGADGSVTGIFHAVVVVSTMDEGIRFFRDLLGMRVTFDAMHDPASLETLLGLAVPRVRSVVVECPDGSEIELAQFLDAHSQPVTRPFDQPGINLLSLRVTDIGALVERLTAGGYTFTSGVVTQPLPDGAAAKVVVCRGPDGIAITLTELPKGRRNLGETGRN